MAFKTENNYLTKLLSPIFFEKKIDWTHFKDYYVYQTIYRSLCIALFWLHYILPALHFLILMIFSESLHVICKINLFNMQNGSIKNNASLVIQSKMHSTFKRYAWLRRQEQANRLICINDFKWRKREAANYLGGKFFFLLLVVAVLWSMLPIWDTVYLLGQ